MKFTDGYWNMREGVIPHFAAGVHEVVVESDAFTVYAPTKQIITRGDTLNLALITVRFSAPLPNVIRVQIVHHKGGRATLPRFELAPPGAHEVRIEDGEQVVMLTSGALSARCIRPAAGRSSSRTATGSSPAAAGGPPASWIRRMAASSTSN